MTRLNPEEEEEEEEEEEQEEWEEEKKTFFHYSCKAKMQYSDCLKQKDQSESWHNAHSQNY